MKKIFAILAIMSLTGLLVSCTEAVDGNPFGDGEFVSIHSSSSGNGSTGSCTTTGSCQENVSQGNCRGTFSPNGECNIGIYIYCAYGYDADYDYDYGYYRDCDLIGGFFTKSKADCLSIYASIFATYNYCITNGYDTYD